MRLLPEYIRLIDKARKTGAATEHSYRSALEYLFNSLGRDIQALNEPKRVAVGAPDFIIQQSGLVVGHVEAKDLPVDLRELKGANRDQKARYLKGFQNLIYTNCLDFEFYRNGELTSRTSIAELGAGLAPKPENYDTLENLLRNFVQQRPQTITSPRVLAELMAGKALLIKDVLANALREDDDEETELANQYDAFRTHLIHDITPEDFADIYAETLAYGMFAARVHDRTLDTFSRAEALENLPKSNPFLRSLFSYIAGPELDERISWIVDELADVFRACDVRKLMKGFGKLSGRDDPFLHFYETFLASYNPAKRKARGVWYTPEAVVTFIVRAVDGALRDHFHLADGLADTSKVTIDWDTGQRQLTKDGIIGKSGKNAKVQKEVHRVQVLDPATGTGTFLAEVIKRVAPAVKGSAEGMWSKYVERDLIPRVHGFELLMASYAMCHIKLDMILAELGYSPTKAPPRLSVYLTNSLEEGDPANQLLPFAQWLSNEVKQANAIKRDMPIMCVIGNPPYSGESSNKGPWIMDLMSSYKNEPGGREKLKERNSKWINDDYVKFIRLAEHLIDRNGQGIVGFITNHGYLDNPTFRGMRWKLLSTFDRIEVLDLHGSSKKQEVAPDGGADKNVFDIQQGVSILIAVKRPGKKGPKPLARVYHSEMWGTREEKYERLWRGPEDVIWTELTPIAPHFSMKPRDHDTGTEYEKGFSIRDLFLEGGTGVVTKRDNLTIHRTPGGVWQAVQDMLHLSELEVRTKYDLPEDVRDWKYAWAKRDLQNHTAKENIKPISYRPFDKRFIYFTGQSRGFVGWPVEKLMRHFVGGENVGLCTARSNKNASPDHFFVTDCMMETKYAESSTQSAVFPLYLYPGPDDLDRSRRVNLDPKLFEKLRSKARDKVSGLPSELDVFDYIYGALHCPDYRSTYAEFLKSDFPRVPWPKSPKVFWRVVAAGGQLRRLHLMQPAAVGEPTFPFKGEGGGLVDKIDYSDGSIWINASQRFQKVPAVAWSMRIGGYYPAQKWLKDKRGSELNLEEVRHYQRVLEVLVKTNSIMQSITLN